VIKTQEATDLQSCWNKALPNERVFVLLARDPAAPEAIREWVAERITSGKSHRDDPQIVEALLCAALMDDERDAVRAEISHVETVQEGATP
jgi:hypothetical protein